MLAKIFKYRLDITNTQIIEMPHGARLLHVDAQGEELCLWALVDLAKSPSSVAIRIVGTGQPVVDLGDLYNYVGTAQMPSGLVWHVFFED